MARNTSISLGDHMADFVDGQVKNGRYGSASEVIRAGLRLLEEREAAMQSLRDALDEGERSGPATEFDFEAYLAGRRRASGA
ncbi:type II toxin-antitoxin system ParD family antitoxin [Roseomonas sp. HJA6]|uniref:Type II toxin-antitoxin system ParD family antitoxin n=1 Tax=Roseomonas alba TaxID=2846776 RepID=A0ABS7A3X1_9PROT|nr:type II toxin-antitoxin system ParD family antitoxin [Neoroseomonas alba]MBW6396795.1 type II toxin-antitoxin system ParD family antitoxin [Neoroseomonas alba]